MAMLNIRYTAVCVRVTVPSGLGCGRGLNLPSPTYTCSPGDDISNLQTWDIAISTVIRKLATVSYVIATSVNSIKPFIYYIDMLHFAPMIKYVMLQFTPLTVTTLG